MSEARDSSSADLREAVARLERLTYASEEAEISTLDLVTQIVDSIWDNVVVLGQATPPTPSEPTRTPGFDGVVEKPYHPWADSSTIEDDGQ
jgi:hypothetical protein